MDKLRNFPLQVQKTGYPKRYYQDTPYNIDVALHKRSYIPPDLGNILASNIARQSVLYQHVGARRLRYSSLNSYNCYSHNRHKQY